MQCTEKQCLNAEYILFVCRHHFNKYGWPSSIWGDAPESDDARSKLVDALQDKKTEFYKKIVEEAAEVRLVCRASLLVRHSIGARSNGHMYVA